MAILVAVPTTYAVDESRLSEYRRAKAARLKQPQDRARCLCAGVALDVALQAVGLCEKTAVIALGEYGKPYLAEHPEWQFSLSHSGGWAVCALSDAPIGVDVEQYRSLSYLSLAKRHFTPNEIEQIYRCEEREREAVFFRLWTEKESVLKATGHGLSALSQYEAFIAQGYTTRSYPLDGYALSVCTTGEFPAALTVIE